MFFKIFICAPIIFHHKFYLMGKNKNSISRKDALKTMGGLSFGLPFLPSMLGNLSVESKKPKNPFLKKNKIKGKPNILWITTEGVPINALSCYGSNIAPTPNIDRIAKDGLLFKNSFCNNALCAPSRATLLTGKYNHLNGMYSNYAFAANGQPASTFDPK